MEMQLVMVILKIVCWSYLASKSGLVSWFLRSFGQVSARQAGSLASQPAKRSAWSGCETNLAKTRRPPQAILYVILDH